MSSEEDVFVLPLTGKDSIEMSDSHHHDRPLSSQYDGIQMESASKDPEEATQKIQPHVFELSVEAALLKIGSFGKYQKILTMLMGIPWIICAMHVMAIVFIDPQIEDEWNLKGDRKWLLGFVGSMFFVGMLIGAGFFGYLADHSWGRKKALLISICVFAIASVCSAFSPEIYTLSLFRLICGTGVAGVMVAGWVLPAEFWGPDTRAVVGSLFHCFFATGIMTVALFAFIVRPWRWLLIAISVPCLPLIIFLSMTKYMIPESPRWLVLRGREEDAKDILLHAGRVSNRPLPPSMSLFVPDVLRRKGHIKDLFGWSWIRYQTIIMMFMWFVASLAYYGISLSINNLSGNLYLNVFLSGIAEYPANAIVVFALKHLGRRLGNMVIFGFTAMALLVFLLMETANGQTAMAMVGKFGAAGCFAGVYLYATEIFPTELRNTGSGLASQAARVAGILTPFIVLLGIRWAMGIICVVAFIATASVRGLPETKGRRLLETLAEMKEFVFRKSVKSTLMKREDEMSSRDEDMSRYVALTDNEE